MRTTSERVGNAILVLGLLLLIYPAAIWLYAAGFQSYHNWTFQHRAIILSPTVPQPQEHMVIGRLDIPRIKLSVMVVEGTGEQDLIRGAGHIPGTGALDGNGNFAIAGHRDTFFRSLRHVRVNDVIELTTAAARRRYVVTNTEIAQPEDVSVLKPAKTATLTLVSCYPFTYVGPAPERFIVHARPVQAAKTAP
jgi:sortase A